MSWRLRGYDVVLDDINKDQLSKALERIEKNMHRQAGALGLIKWRITDVAPRRAMARIRTTVSLDDLRDRELVIEKAGERRTSRPRRRYSRIPSASGVVAEAILATNTSSIPVTRLASSTNRPEHFIGIHFMNPVPLMRLIEVIPGIATETTYEAALVWIAARQESPVPRISRPSSSIAS